MKEKPFDFLLSHPFYKKMREQKHYYEYLFCEKDKTVENKFVLFIPKRANVLSEWRSAIYFEKEKWAQPVIDYYHLNDWSKDIIEKSNKAMYERDKIRHLVGNVR